MDPFLSQFAVEAFNVRAFVGSIMRDDSLNAGSKQQYGVQSAAEQALETVERAITHVDQQLRTLVANNQDALLDQANSNRGLAERTTSLSLRAKSLQTLTSRARSDVLVPAEALECDVRAFERVLEASECIREVQALHTSMRKARLLWQAVAAGEGKDTGESTGGWSDAGPSPTSLESADGRILSRLSPLLSQAHEVLANPKLRGVHLVDTHRVTVATMSTALRNAAVNLLRKSLSNLDAASIGTCCQILHDLHCLPVEAHAALDSLVAEAGENIRAALDVAELAAVATASAAAAASGSALPVPAAGLTARTTVSHAQSAGLLPPPGATAMWRGLLWGRLEACLDVVQRCLVQAWTLVHVLARRKDSMHGSTARGTKHGQEQEGVSLLLDIAQYYAKQQHGHATEAAAHPAWQSVQHGEHAGVRLLRRAWTGVLDIFHVEFQVLAGTNSTSAAAGGKGADTRAGAASFASSLVSAATSLMSTRDGGGSIPAHAAGRASLFIRGVLIEAYPRLHYLMLEALTRASRSVQLRSAGDDGSGSDAYSSLLGGMVLAFPSSSTEQDRSVVTRKQTLGGTDPSPLPAVYSMLHPRLSGSALFACACSVSGLQWALAPLRQMYLTKLSQKLAEAVAAMFPASNQQVMNDRKAAQKRYVPSVGPTSSSSLPSAAALVAMAGGFTTSPDFQKLAAEPQPEPPSSSSVLALTRIIHQELSSCKPAGYQGPTVMHASRVHASSSAGAGLTLPDADLYCVVAEQIAHCVTSLLRSIEQTCSTGPASTAVSDQWVATPGQVLNVSLATRMDDLRSALLKVIADIPLWPPPLDRLAEIPASDPAITSAATSRLAVHPLSAPLPPALLLIGMAAHKQAEQAAAGKKGRILAAQCAQAVLYSSLLEVDGCVERLLFPWLLSLCGPLERTISKVTDALYSKEDAQGMVDSDWVAVLEGQLTKLSSRQLPSNSSTAAASALGSLPRHLIAARCAQLFVRYASILRSTDDMGRARLSKDASQLQACLVSFVSAGAGGVSASATDGGSTINGPHASPASSVWNSAHAELRAFKSLLFCSTDHIGKALALIIGHGSVGSDDLSSRSLAAGAAATDGLDQAARAYKSIAAVIEHVRPCTVLHVLNARLPRACDLPHTAARVDARTYVDWQDSVIISFSAPTGKAKATQTLSNASSSASSDASSVLSTEQRVPAYFPRAEALAGLDEAVWTRIVACLQEFEAKMKAGMVEKVEDLPEHALLRTYGEKLLHFSRHVARA